MDEGYSSERIADRLEITDCIYRFCRGVDRKNWDLVRDCYHPGAIDLHGSFDGKAEEFLEFTKKRHETIGLSLHNVCNILIEFGDRDHAIAESYVLAWQTQLATADDPAPRGNFYAARYVDHFARREGRWKILERVLAFESATGLNEDILSPQQRAARLTGRRDEEDVLWTMRARHL